MKKVSIYTDGACSGNPGPGGWGAVLLYGNNRKELSGSECNTTNNRMELMAAINALEVLKVKCLVDLYTDSAYLCNAFTQNWIANWQRNGWVTTAKKPVENKDLWERLISLSKIHSINSIKVKGHAENELNNYCDMLARREIKENADRLV